ARVMSGGNKRSAIRSKHTAPSADTSPTRARRESPLHFIARSRSFPWPCVRGRTAHTYLPRSRQAERTVRASPRAQHRQDGNRVDRLFRENGIAEASRY